MKTLPFLKAQALSGIPPWKILIIDDNPDIHKDFEDVFQKPSTTSSQNKFLQLEQKIFDTPKVSMENTEYNFDLLHALQGNEGYEQLRKSLDQNISLSVAFIDVRMPPGWNGIDTAAKLWELDPDLEIVFCSAYSDFSIEDMYSAIQDKKDFLIIKKPFEPVEVRQAAISLCQKWKYKKFLLELGYSL